ncbi:MAG TPA: AlkA N-terminal domain-containing protein [Pyrinomonadaceae bacterium]|jgi:DNA-3-methyladenine glycosylase II
MPKTLSAKTLTRRPETVIAARAPFDFAATARFLRFTAAELVDTFADGVYRRAWHFEDRLYLLSVAARGPAPRPELVITLAPAAGGTPVEAGAMTAAAQTVAHMFSVEHDLIRLAARVARDPLLRQLEAAHRGLRLARWPVLFEALVRSIIMQQIATPVAITLTRRLVERFGETLRVGAQTFHAFPRATTLARADAEELRALGLTGAKAAGIVALAQACADGALDAAALARADNETIIARLTRLRGVGRWTAEWALVLYFGRADVFPAGDLFLRGVVAKYYNRGGALGEREVRQRAARRWGAWAGYAAVYFLAGMRAGTITLRPARVLSSAPAA